MNQKICKLAVLSQQQDLLPLSVKVEYDPLDLALPEPIMNAKRIIEYILAQPVYLTDSNRFTGMFRLWNPAAPETVCTVPGDIFSRHGHTHFWEAAKEFYNHYKENLVVFEWQHSTPNYENILKNGIEDCLAKIERYKQTYQFDQAKFEFLQAEEIICKGALAWSEKCADAHFAAAQACKDEVRKQELLKLAETCRRVPLKPVESFYEAIQAINFCFQFLPDSIGTLDRFLFPYYQHDIENNIITREKAKELLQELFVYISNYTVAGTPNADRSAECHFAIGGYTEFGEDGFNELSRLIVEALMEIDTRRPSISLRWTKKTPFEVLKFMLDCERHDNNKRLAFVSDEPRIRAFMDICGFTFSEAVRYTMVGCNEPSMQGSVWFGGCTVNLARSLSNTLYNRKDDIFKCKTYEEFFGIYREELAKDIDRIIYYSNAFNDMRAKDHSVLSCFLLDGCIENGKSAVHGGCTKKIGGFNLMGLTCVIDSLSMIRQYVFDEKKTSLPYLVEVLESNWEKDEDLRLDILKNGKFFGNNDPLSDGVSRELTAELFRLTKNRRLKIGASILFGTLAGYNPHFARFGETTKATPDGRYNGETFMVGSGQSNGKDRKGLLPLMKSLAQMDPNHILCGPVVCNMLIDEAVIRNDESFDKFCRMVENYFRIGGLHIQLNYVTKEELLAAQKAPEKYKSLKVRVSGYSAPFVKLSDGIQNEIIHRTEIHK